MGDFTVSEDQLEMEPYIRKLHKIGLPRFITKNGTMLYNTTVNQTQVAVNLQMGSDIAEIIDHEVGDFAKNQKLYSYVEKMATERTFLVTLNKTNNERVINLIKPILERMDQGGGIRFNIPELNNPFYGREHVLDQLSHELKYHTCSAVAMGAVAEMDVDVKVITGASGVGKSETVKRYISQYWDDYNSFLWIDAENERSMTNSFLKVADEVKIPIKNGAGKSRDIEEIVKDIYNKICAGGKASLIIFDNAEGYPSCKKFLPWSLLHPNSKKPVFLATSTNSFGDERWESDTNKIRIIIQDLPPMSPKERREFILKKLEIPDPDPDSDTDQSTTKLVHLIGGLPLTLEQATACIKYKKAKDRNNIDAICGYTSKFKSKEKKIQNVKGVSPSLFPISSPSLLISWDVTYEKLNKLKEPKGDMVIDLIKMMAFLYPDQIPTQFFLRVLQPDRPRSWILRLWELISRRGQSEAEPESEPNPEEDDNLDPKSKELKQGLKLLEKLSMIKITPNSLTIHRQVQWAVIQKMSNSGTLIPVFNKLVEKCSVALKRLNFSSNNDNDNDNTNSNNANFNANDIFLNIHHIINHPLILTLKLIPFDKPLVTFMIEFGLVLLDAGRFSESLELYHKFQNRFDGVLQEETTCTFRRGREGQPEVDIEFMQTLGITEERLRENYQKFLSELKK